MYIMYEFYFTWGHVANMFVYIQIYLDNNSKRVYIYFGTT